MKGVLEFHADHPSTGLICLREHHALQGNYLSLLCRNLSQDKLLQFFFYSLSKSIALLIIDSSLGRVAVADSPSGMKLSSAA